MMPFYLFFLRNRRGLLIVSHYLININQNIRFSQCIAYLVILNHTIYTNRFIDVVVYVIKCFIKKGDLKKACS
jgi:hypothetical protein